MNAVAQVFVDVYENDRDITPKELIDAGWTYKHLAVYMHCCEVIRAIGITWGRLWLKGESEQKATVREYCYGELEKIAEQLTVLIGEEIHIDLAVASFFNYSYAGSSGGLFQVRCRNNYDSNSSEWFSCLLKNEEYAFSTISFFIRKLQVQVGHLHGRN